MGGRRYGQKENPSELSSQNAGGNQPRERCETAWLGNWLSAEGCTAVLGHASGPSLRAKRDYAMLAMLFGCRLRRSVLVGLQLDDVQVRQGHWAVVDVIGKGGHIRTVPIPFWVKATLDGGGRDQRRKDIPCRG